MSDLVEKIRAAIDEEERIALWAAAVPGGAADWIYVEGSADAEPVVVMGERTLHTDYLDKGSVPRPREARHIAHQSPKRALRRITAYRKLLDVHVIENRMDNIGKAPRLEYSCRRCDWTPEEYQWDYGPACEAVMALAEEYELVDPPA